MWEIFSLGATPFAESMLLSNSLAHISDPRFVLVSEHEVEVFIMSGGTLPVLTRIPPQLFQLPAACWTVDLAQRPVRLILQHVSQS